MIMKLLPTKLSDFVKSLGLKFVKNEVTDKELQRGEAFKREMETISKIVYEGKIEPKKMTNADRIRSMNDEELADSRIDRIDIYCRIYCRNSSSPTWIGDFCGVVDSYDKALELELEWLRKGVE